MPKFKVKVSLERIVSANDEEEAGNNFWFDLDEANNKENATTENKLTDSMEIKEIREHCLDCGITLDEGFEQEDERCGQCQAVKDKENDQVIIT